MDIRGWLHIVREHDRHTAAWAYWVYFAPYERGRRTLLQRVCRSPDEVDAVLSGLGIGFERLHVIADVERVGARTVSNVHTTAERLYRLGFR
jgi:hypothetical protein